MTANEVLELAHTLRREIEETGGVETIEVVYELLGEVERLFDAPVDELPTVEQGLALARFLRPAFRESVHVGLRSAKAASTAKGG